MTSSGHAPTSKSSSQWQTGTLEPVSSLRPRTRRLISGLEDELATTPSARTPSPSRSPHRSPFNSRPVTPIPPTSHPSSATPNRTLRPAPLWEGDEGFSPKLRQTSSGALSSLWGSSWGTIQGLASTVLGSDTSHGAISPKRLQVRTQPPKSRGRDEPPSWGPSHRSQSTPTAGMQEDMDTKVRAMKKRDLLYGSAQTDTLGRYKRRNSDARDVGTAGGDEHADQAALVYLHVVASRDTLAGISIKYGCDLSALRRANRMWANDSVQSRKHIMVPVDASSVKGRPVPEPSSSSHEEDLLGGDWMPATPRSIPSIHEIPPSTNGLEPLDGNGAVLEPSTSAESADTPWKHESWVMLPNDTEAVEIVRLPRRAMGFFPPPRRKSQSYTDASAPGTPPQSVEIGRPAGKGKSGLADLLSRPPVASSSSPPGTPRSSMQSSTRPRALSRLSSTSTTTTRPAPRFFTAPGIGPLDHTVSKPGPAEDPLNRIFARRLPNVHPPENPFGTHVSGYTENGAFFPPPLWSPHHLDSYVTAHAASRGPNLEDVPVQVERWLRKMASRAATALSDSSGGGSAKHASGGGLGPPSSGGSGDLIELMDSFEIGGDDHEAAEGPSGATSIGLHDYDSMRGRPPVLGDRKRGKGD